ncbi:MAG: hypothetical protein ACLQIB_05395 [Isosphaeraceae bacterium]
MTGPKRIEKYDKFGLQLTQVERNLILEGVTSLPEEIVQTIQRTPAKQPIRMTLDDWDELAGYIASEANNTGDKKLQKRLDAVFAKINDLLERHNDEEPSLMIKPPLAEESVQLAEWAAKILIGAEQLGIKSKTVTQFPLPGAHKSILMKLPIASANLKAKLAKDKPLLTVGEVGGLLISVSEALLDATPLQQFALILSAKRLKECLEAEVATAMKPGAKRIDEGGAPL